MKRKIIITITIILISCLCVVITINFSRPSPQPTHEKVQSIHRSIPTFTDQQLGVLVGLATSPKWLRQNIAANQLVYGIVKPSDTVPTGVADYSYLVTTDNQNGTVIFFKEEGQSVVIKYSFQQNEKLKSKKLSLSQLDEEYYRTVSQKRKVEDYVARLRTE